MSEIKYPVRVEKDVDTIIYSDNKLAGAGYAVIDKNDNIICALLTKANAHTIADALNEREKMVELLQSKRVRIAFDEDEGKFLCTICGLYYEEEDYFDVGNCENPKCFLASFEQKGGSDDSQ